MEMGAGSALQGYWEREKWRDRRSTRRSPPLSASLPELSEPGSTTGTVQEPFVVAGDSLEQRGEGLQV